MKTSHKFNKWIPFIILLIPAVLFFSRAIFADKFFYAFDLLAFLYPWCNYFPAAVNNPLISDPIFCNSYLDAFHFQQSLKNGHLLLWREDLFCGMPFLMYWQCPIKVLLHVIFPLFTATSLLLFSHLYFSGVFSFLFLRNNRMSVLPALTGAMAWMFNGYIMVWFEYEFSVMFAAVLPASLWLIDRAIRRQNLLNWLLVALANAYAIAIVFPHLMYYYFICGGAYLLFRLWRQNAWLSAGRQAVIRTAISYGGTVILAIICNAGFWLIAATQLATTQREVFIGNDLYQKTGQLPVKYLLTMLHPELFGTPLGNKNFIPMLPEQYYNNYNELCVYGGLIILMLALIAICRPFRGNNPFFLTLGLLSLWCAAGCFLYPYLAKLLPGLAYSTPTRILFLLGFSLSMLSASGMQIILHHRKKGFLLFIPLGIFLLLIASLWYVNTPTGCQWLFQGSQEKASMALLQQFNGWDSFYVLKTLGWGFLGISLICIGVHIKRKKWRTIIFSLLAFFAIAEIFYLGWRYNTTTLAAQAYPVTKGIDFLQKDKNIFRIGMKSNQGGESCFSALSLESIGGYASVISLQYEQFFNMLTDEKVDLKGRNQRWLQLVQFSPTLLSLTNTRYILAPGTGIPVVSPSLEKVYDGEMSIYRNNRCLPRAFFVPSAEIVDSEMDAARKLCSFSLKDFLHKVIIKRRDLADNIQGNTIPEGYKPQINSVIIEERHPGYLKLAVNAPSDGWVFISNNYDPSWQAKIDGVSSRIARANFTFQAIPVTRGPHAVVIRFMPTVVIFFTILSYLMWVIMIVTVVILMLRQSKSFNVKTRKSTEEKQ